MNPHWAGTYTQRAVSLLMLAVILCAFAPGVASWSGNARACSRKCCGGKKSCCRKAPASPGQVQIYSRPCAQGCGEAAVEPSVLFHRLLVRESAGSLSCYTLACPRAGRDARRAIELRSALHQRPPPPQET